MALSLPQNRYPDTRFQSTVSQSQERWLQDIESVLGPNGYLSDYVRADQRRPIDAETLFEAYKGKSVYHTVQLALQIEEMKGWHTVFAKPERVEGFEQVFRTKIAPRYILDRAPEGVAPRFVSVMSEEKRETLGRFNLGAHEHHDFFKTPEGRESMLEKQAIIVSAAIITSKIMVEQAIINDKLYYKDWQRKNGPLYTNVIEALNDELRLFGAFNKDEKAIYKVNGYIEEIVKLSGTGANFDSLVVCPGTLNLISLGNKFETEAYRRGDAISERTLTLGARVMERKLPGKLIYENPTWIIKNLPADEIQSFRRIAMIGEYVMIDGSDHGRGRESYPAENLLSVKHRDLSINNYSEWNIKNAIRQSQRWDESGNLSVAHDRLIQDLPSILSRSGVTIKNGLIDPYIWQSGVVIGADSMNASSISPSNLHKIERWGEMNIHYWTVDQNLLHGEHAARQIRKSGEITNEDMDNLRLYKELVNELYDIPESMNEQETKALVTYFYFLAILNPPGSSVLKGNSFGSFNRIPKIVRVADNFDEFVFVSEELKTATIKDNIVTLTQDLNQGYKFSASFAKPWGFVGLNHFRALARLSDDDTKNYQQDVFKKAVTVVKSVDRYLSILKKFYPESDLWSPLYVPDFAKSGTDNQEFDSLHSVAFNVLDRVRYPIWIRFNNEKDKVENKDQISSLSEILFGGDDNNKYKKFLKLVANELRPSVIDYISKLKNVAIQKIWNDNPNFSDSYKIARNLKVPSTVKEFLEKEVDINSQAGVNVLVAFLNQLYGLSKGQQIQPLTAKALEDLKAYKPSNVLPTTSFQKKRTRDLTLNTTHEYVEGWVNSRLLLNPIIFKILNENADDMVGVSIAPEDPEHGGIVATTEGGRLGKNDDYFEYARSRDENMLFGMSGTVFSNPSLLRNVILPNSSSKRARTESRFSRMEQERAQLSEPSGYDPSSGRYVGRYITRSTPGGSINKKQYLTYRLNEISKRAKTDEIRVASILAIFTRVVQESLFTWIDHGLPIPDSCFILAQPFIRLYTEGMVAFDGSGVASLMYGHEDVSNQYNNMQKEWIMHFSIYLGCGIRDSSKVMFIPDVRISGYLGGMDQSVFESIDEFDPQNIDFSNKKSAFVFSLGSTFSREVALRDANPLSLFGKYEAKYIPYQFSRHDNIFSSETPQWPSFLFYNSIWQFTAINQGILPDYSSFVSIKDTPFINGLMYFAKHLGWSDRDHDHTKVFHGTGHLADFDAPMRAALEGKVEFLNNLYDK